MNELIEKLMDWSRTEDPDFVKGNEQILSEQFKKLLLEEPEVIVNYLKDYIKRYRYSEYYKAPYLTTEAQNIITDIEKYLKENGYDRYYQTLSFRN